MQFVGILNNVVMLKKMFENGKDDVSMQLYYDQIVSLEAKIIQHDFALLKL